jgi:4a-hydroxytetrahydrobiopterin dehydratase
VLRQTIRNALHAAAPVDFERDLRWRNVRRIHIDRFSVMAKNVNNSQRPACLFVQRTREFARTFWRCAVPARKLAEDEIDKLLSRMNGWRLVSGKLHKQFECKDFNAAFGSMTRVALIAEAMNHHPEWANVWNRVSFDLSTHSVKGISDLDFVLAEKIEEIFATQTASRATSGT